jgi:hypothetical protein
VQETVAAPFEGVLVVNLHGWPIEAMEHSVDHPQREVLVVEDGPVGAVKESILINGKGEGSVGYGYECRCRAQGCGCHDWTLSPAGLRRTILAFSAFGERGPGEGFGVSPP